VEIPVEASPLAVFSSTQFVTSLWNGDNATSRTVSSMKMTRLCEMVPLQM
jgi:hypothetical protein